MGSIPLVEAKIVSKTPASSVGVLQSLNQLSTLSKDEFATLQSDYRQNFQLLNKIKTISEFKIAPFFLKSLVLYSDLKYQAAILKDECIFYSLLENDFLKTSRGKIKKIPVKYTTQDGIQRKVLLFKADYLNHIYSKKCLGNKDIKTLYTKKNIQKTVTSFNYPIPKTLNQCLSILDDWKINPQLPYLCKIVDDMKEGEIAKKKKKTIADSEVRQRRILNKAHRKMVFLKKKIPLLQRSYLKNLCYNFSKPLKFCNQYISKDTWIKVLNGERPKYLLSYKCKNMLNTKKELKYKELNRCARKYTTVPEICTSKGSLGFESYFPKPDCNEISHALEKSHLKTQYHDCPGNIENEAIITTARIMRHFEDIKYDSTPDKCVNESNFLFANLNINFHNEKAWPLKACYISLVTGKEECDVYIPGNDSKNKLSEGQVVGNILYKIQGAPRRTICEKVPRKRFSSVAAKYKTGCYIIYKKNECTNFHCPRKILYDLKKITGITFKGNPLFDYFPTSFRNEKFSLDNILLETYKLKKFKIRNLSDLEFFLDQYPRSIVHGIGCIEDILPKVFKKRTMNSCRPTPFIIDGIYKNMQELKLTLRLGIDDIHSPRLVKWNFIFSAISSYQFLHPLNTWTLYGIRQ